MENAVVGMVIVAVGIVVMVVNVVVVAVVIVVVVVVAVARTDEVAKVKQDDSVKMWRPLAEVEWC